jgi:leucyl-tRNA synthetase
MQRNWTGRSEGAEVRFAVENGDALTVFTTRPDTLFGATYCIIAPEHECLATLVTAEQRAALDSYIKSIAGLGEAARGDAGRTKTGVFTGATVINPANGARLPSGLPTMFWSATARARSWRCPRMISGTTRLPSRITCR